jgi:hypothetical protein
LAQADAPVYFRSGVGAVPFDSAQGLSLSNGLSKRLDDARLIPS